MTQYIYYNPEFHVWQVARQPFESCELNEIPTVVSTFIATPLLLHVYASWTALHTRDHRTRHKCQRGPVLSEARQLPNRL